VLGLVQENAATYIRQASAANPKAKAKAYNSSKLQKEHLRDPAPAVDTLLSDMTT
jgi:hypothetical protein